jgi:hypothetical protein
MVMDLPLDFRQEQTSVPPGAGNTALTLHGCDEVFATGGRNTQPDA